MDRMTRIPQVRSTGYMDESYARMKKSCERIAAVLGIKDVNADMQGLREQAAIHRRDIDTSMRQSSPLKPSFSNLNDNQQTVTLGNMVNPSRMRSISPDKEDGQPSGYKSLREKSPMKQMANDPDDEDSHSATRFASVSFNHCLFCVV